ncbi:MAG: Ger(x)C family spore germination C-terminal domain-containing protein [Syntrophothermus sp.]
MFRGDKMVGWLGEEEAQGLLLVTGRAKNGAIAVGHLPDMAGEATLRPPLESFVRAAQSTPSAKAARSALTSPSA